MARPRQISDEQIDAAARETFLELGPGAAVSLVAQKLGVSHSALLQRAGSKELLMLRALGPGAPDVATRLEAKPPARGQAAQLARLLEELLVFHERILPGLLVLRARGLPVAPPDGVEPPTVRLRRLLTAWLMAASAMRRRRATVLADALLGAIEARCFNAWVGGPSAVKDTSQGRFARGLVSELVTELAAPPRKETS